MSKEVLLTGPQGKIEAKYHHNPQPNSPIALLLAPDPNKGASMDNRVMYNMFKTLAQEGFSVLRFNYAGIGKSFGEFSNNGETEIDDAMSMLNWLQEANGGLGKVFVCGYSFGSWVAMQLVMRRPDIENFVLISPPVVKYDFHFIAPYSCKGLIIQGSEDKQAPETKTELFVNELIEEKSMDVKYKVIEGANHFYPKKYEQSMVKTLHKYIKKI